MGLNLNAQKNLPIGVDLGSSMIKIAQLRAGGNGLELLAARSVEIPFELHGDLARRLKFCSENMSTALKIGGFKGRKAVVSIPAAATFLEPVKIPIVPAAETDLTVRGELQGKLPYPVQEAVIRHILVGTVYGAGQEMQERIVVAVSRADLDAHLGAARRAGLDVVGISVEACAVFDCFARLLRRTSDTCMTLFLDIGLASTQVVLAQGKQMVFARNLLLGGRTLDQCVADTMHISLPQAHWIRRKMLAEAKDAAAEDDLFRLLDAKIAEITEEILRCLMYCGSSLKTHTAENLIFVGGEAHNNRLCQSIAQRLNLPAQVGDPLAGVRRAAPARQTFAADTRGPQPAWAVAIGLGLGTMQAA